MFRSRRRNIRRQNMLNPFGPPPPVRLDLANLVDSRMRRVRAPATRAVPPARLPRPAPALRRSRRADCGRFRARRAARPRAGCCDENTRPGPSQARKNGERRRIHGDLASVRHASPAPQHAGIRVGEGGGGVTLGFQRRQPSPREFLRLQVRFRARNAPPGRRRNPARWRSSRPPPAAAAMACRASLISCTGAPAHPARQTNTDKYSNEAQHRVAGTLATAARAVKPAAVIQCAAIADQSVAPAQHARQFPGDFPEDCR